MSVREPLRSLPCNWNSQKEDCSKNKDKANQKYWVKNKAKSHNLSSANISQF